MKRLGGRVFLRERFDIDNSLRLAFGEIRRERLTFFAAGPSSSAPFVLFALSRPRCPAPSTPAAAQRFRRGVKRSSRSACGWR